MKRFIISILIFVSLNLFAQTYYYDDSVPFNWIEIKDTGTAVSWDNNCTYYNNDDDKVVVNIGFTFYFGSTPYTQISIMTNGLLQFGSDTGLHRYYNNQCMPVSSNPPSYSGCNTDQPDLYIAPYWDDLNPSQGGGVYYQTIGTAPNRIFVIEWYEVPHYYNSGQYTFEVILYERNGDIKIQYNSSSTDGSSATIGVEIDDSDYTEYSCNSSSVSSGTAIRFYNTVFPIANYYFDECYPENGIATIIDHTGRGFDGIPKDATTVNDGVVCNSIDFTEDSIDDYVKLPGRIIRGTDAISVSFWIKTTYTGLQAIVSGESVYQDNEFLIFFTSDTRLYVFVKGSRERFDFDSIADNHWHHFVITRSGKIVKVYKDGSFVGSWNNAPTGTLNIDENGLYIGQEQDSVGGDFDINQDCQGYVDELIFWRRVLSASEVQDIYDNQSAGKNYDGTSRDCNNCNPNGDWRLDECVWDGTEGEVKDSSGNNLNGTAKGDNSDGRVAEVYNGQFICRSAHFRGWGYVVGGTYYEAKYYMEIPDNDLLSPLATDRSMTIMAWFKTTADSGTILSKSGSNREYRVYVDNGDLKVDLYNNYNSTFSTTISTGVNDGAWHFFAVNAKLIGSPGSYTLIVRPYFDGNTGTVSSFSSFNNYSNTGSPLYIGAMSWSDGNTNDYFDGYIDEVKIFKYFMNEKAMDNIYQNEQDGYNYDGSERVCVPCRAIADWRMDECLWSGDTGEIIDSTGHGHDGTAYNGANTSDISKLCRAGYFDNESGDVQYGMVPDSDKLSPHAFPDGEMTLMAWVMVLSYPDSSEQGRVPIVAKGNTGNWEYALYVYDWHAVGFSVWNLSGSGYGEPAGGEIPLKEWHHLTGVVKKGEYVRIYMDGNLIAEDTTLNGTTGNGTSPLYFARRGSGNHYFNGYIDEVKLFARALTQAQIQEIINREEAHYNYNGTERTCNTCSEAAYIEITHDGNGIVCYPERVHIRICDSGGNTITNYLGTITLTTSTNHGTWYTSYSGVSNDDPPQGTLTDNTSDDGQATYQFVAGDSGEITLFLRDTHLETLTIYATDGTADSTGHDSGSLVFKASGFVFDSIDNQISGKDFSVTVKAVGEDPDTGDCTILDYDGTKTITAYVIYQNPSSGSTDLLINGTSVSSSGTNITLNFSNGVCTFTANYPDAGQISIKFEDNSEGITGDSNLFVVKPFGFYVSATDNPGASDASGAVFKKAGEQFELVVTAVNWQSADDSDNDGVPDDGADLSDNSITPNYSGTADLTANLIAPAGGVSGSLNPTSISLSSGEGSDSSMTYSEVGIITVKATDSDYLGAGSIEGISSNIGRFIPDSFRFDSIDEHPACSSTFTYGGQSFTVDVSMSAINTDGDITQNYTGDFAKLDFSGLSCEAMVNASTNGDGTLTVSSTTVSFSNGTSSFTLPCTYDWSSEHNPEEISIKITATDSDNVSGSGMSNYVPFRYGRLRIENGYAPSADQNLTLNVYAEYYQDGDYVICTDDNCTTYTDSDISLYNYTGNLDSGETSITSYSVISNGEATITLSAPGIGNEGTVDLIFTAPSYMHFASGRATFGIYRGNDNIISWEEIFD